MSVVLIQEQPTRRVINAIRAVASNLIPAEMVRRKWSAILDALEAMPITLHAAPVVERQYRASERVWLPVRDETDLKNWRAMGVQTRELVLAEHAEAAVLAERARCIAIVRQSPDPDAAIAAMNDDGLPL